jgi:hypothetical protein
MEFEAGELPDKVYGEDPQDHYQGTNGIKESARMIQADIPERMLVRKTRRKVDPIKQLTQAGYPFNHIGTELVELQGKWEIVSKDVAVIKDGFESFQKSLEAKIDKETTTISNSVANIPKNIRDTFSEQFGLYFDQRMQRVYGTVATIGALGLALYKLVIVSTPSALQGWALLGIAGIIALVLQL